MKVPGSREMFSKSWAPLPPDTRERPFAESGRDNLPTLSPDSHWSHEKTQGKNDFEHKKIWCSPLNFISGETEVEKDEGP